MRNSIIDPEKVQASKKQIDKHTIRNDLAKGMFYNDKVSDFLGNLLYFLEENGQSLTYNEYISMRGMIGKDDNSRYDNLIKIAIEKGYDAKKANRISMLFNDYLTDQHYSLLIKEPFLRYQVKDDPNRIRTLSRSARDVDVKTDLVEKVENRQDKEKVFYSFERKVFNPKDSSPIEDRIDSLFESATNLAPERMSKYKVHTMEMALKRISKTKIDEKPKGISLFSRVYGKISRYLGNK